jgi:molybdopterin-guanine dinucleotide biosynthesis protein A
LEHIIDRFKPQVSSLALNANGDLSRFAEFGAAITADSIPNHPGPLAGILAGLDWAVTHQPAIRWIATVPGDCPFLPTDLVSRLAVAVTPRTMAVVAQYEGRVHPVIGLWSVTLAEELRQAIIVDSLRRVEDWLRRCAAVPVSFPHGAMDPFFNVNTPEDLAEAESLLKRRQC